jgi:hypothetical protein
MLNMGTKTLTYKTLPDGQELPADVYWSFDVPRIGVSRPIGEHPIQLIATSSLQIKNTKATDTSIQHSSSMAEASQSAPEAIFLPPKSKHYLAMASLWFLRITVSVLKSRSLMDPSQIPLTRLSGRKSLYLPY